MKHAIAIAVILAILSGCLGFYVKHLRSSLEMERQAHSQTSAQLESALQRAEGLADNARRCLAREAQALADANARAAIMSGATARQRTAEEKEKVVDDATRGRVVERLNRDL